MNTHISRLSRNLWLWMVLGALVFSWSSATADGKWNHKSAVRAMTRNLYLGADIFRVVDAAFIEDENGNTIPNPNPQDIFFAVAEVFQTMLYTNFPERAEAIADEIERCRPHVIGLQEASTYYIQTPSDLLNGNPEQANELVIDFYSTLDAALKARGLHYEAFFVTNADIEIPMVNPESPTGLSDVRLVDHDILLVQRGLWTRNAYSDNYHYNLSLPLGGIEVEFTRGYVAVEVMIHGKKVQCANTHLEIRGEEKSEFRVIQALQMNELLQVLDGGKGPVILLGDFNSSPEDEVFGHALFGPIVPPYRQALMKGYSDAWLLQDDPDDGYTSGFDEYVSDPTAELTTRIDHIFIDPQKRRIKSVEADVVGDEVEDMTPINHLWPSDHAGVVAKVRLGHPRWFTHRR